MTRSALRRSALAAALALALPLSAVARSDRADVGATFGAFLRALGGARSEIEALPAGRRLAVLALRHHEPRYLAADGAPEALARHAIASGIADREELARVDLADVVVRGERASGQLLAAGLPSGFRAAFVRERGRWCIDLPGTLDAAGRVVAQAAKASDSTEDAVIAGLLYLSSGERPTSEIWEPLAKRRARAATP